MAVKIDDTNKSLGAPYTFRDYLNNNGIGMFSPDGLSGQVVDQVGQAINNVVTGQADYEKDLAMARYEHDLARQDAAEQNAFTAEREDLKWLRDQQAAQEARDYDTAMSNSQISRQVADLKNVGLNPWLAAGGAGASYSGGIMASAASASTGADITAFQGPKSRIFENVANNIGSVISSALKLALIGRIGKVR